MSRTQLFRITWLALGALFVFPLYGQGSCNRPACPASSNPCERSLGRSSTTGQCVYGPADGAVCDHSGIGAADGVCFNLQCESAQCEGIEFFSGCDAPIGGGSEGACISNLCVSAEPVDECVKAGVGRINCCSPEGCATGGGARCAPIGRLDGVPCDPSNFEPPGDPGQTGTCDDGVCVAASGPCAGVRCEPSASDCKRNDCDLSTSLCQEWPVEGEPGCWGGWCLSGVCFVGCSGDHDCNGGNECTGNVCGIGGCSYPPVANGTPCDFDPYDNEWRGRCISGECRCTNASCDDDNVCTVDVCCGGLDAGSAQAECDDAGIPVGSCLPLPDAGIDCVRCCGPGGTQPPSNPADRFDCVAGVCEPPDPCGTEGGCPDAITSVLSMACTESLTGSLVFVPFELTVDPDVVWGATPVWVTLDGVVEYPEPLLDAFLVAYPQSRDVELGDLRATVHLRSGGTGADVTLFSEFIVHSCRLDGAVCDPANYVPGQPGANTDCEPVGSFNPCLPLVPLPTSTDCGPGGLCDTLDGGSGVKVLQCTQSGQCITGPLALPLQARTAVFGADASGTMLFGWDDQLTGATVQVGGPNDGTWNLPPAIFANPSGPNSSRMVIGGAFVALECTMGVDSQGPDGVGSTDPLSSPTPDSLLIAFPIPGSSTGDAACDGMPDGTACDARIPGPATCQAGFCMLDSCTSDAQCDDDNRCTADFCCGIPGAPPGCDGLPVAQCVHAGIPCSDCCGPIPPGGPPWPGDCVGYGPGEGVCVLND